MADDGPKLELAGGALARMICREHDAAAAPQSPDEVQHTLPKQPNRKRVHAALCRACVLLVVRACVLLVFVARACVMQRVSLRRSCMCPVMSLVHVRVV